MDRFLTGIILVRKSLRVRDKFQQLVDVKVRGYNKQYRGRREPLRRPGFRWLDWLLGCLLSPVHAFKSCDPGNFSTPVRLPKSEFVRSLVGLITGILVSLVYLWLLRSALRWPRAAAATASISLLVVLSLGLAFLSYVRLLSLVSLATICSATGRAVIYVYILVLLMRGPVSNMIENAAEIGRGTACAGQQASAAAKVHVEEFGRNFDAVKHMYQEVANGTNRFIDKVEEKAIRGKEAAKKMAQDLEEFANMIPQPPAVELPPWIYLFPAWIPFHPEIKWALRYFYQKFVQEAKEELRRRCRALAERLRVKANETIEAYRVEVRMDRQLNHTSIQDKDWDEVISLVLYELREKTDWLAQVVNILTFVLHPFLTLLVLTRAALYIRSYRRKLHYDNVYITRRIQLIDYKRARQGLETILPVTDARYMNPLSFKLTSFEQRKLWLGIVMLVTNAACTAGYLFADWSLFQSANLVARHRHDVSVDLSPTNCPTVPVNASAIDRDVYSPVARYCMIRDNSEHVQARKDAYEKGQKCFPAPTEPDYQVYTRIGLLLLFCLITTIAEAYTLRLRHAACDYFHPERADQRAGWMYNTALANRGSMAQFVTQKLAARMAGVEIESISLIQRMAATTPCLRSLYKVPEFCSNCGTIGSDRTEWLTCDSCSVARFCDRCQVTLNDLCPICNDKINVLDDGDLSQEEDSGGESDPDEPELQAIRKRLQLMGKKFALRGAADEDDDSRRTEDGRVFPATSRSSAAAESGVRPEELQRLSDNAHAFLNIL